MCVWRPAAWKSAMPSSLSYGIQTRSKSRVTIGDERQKGGQREGKMSVEKGATVERRSEPRGLVICTRLLGGSKDIDGGAVRCDSVEGRG